MNIIPYKSMYKRHAFRLTVIALTAVASTYLYVTDGGTRIPRMGVGENIAYFLMGTLVPLGTLAMAGIFAGAGDALQELKKFRLAVLVVFSILPFAGGVLAYVHELDYAWKYRGGFWDFLMNAQPFLWVACFAGILGLPVIRALWPKMLPPEPSSEGGRSARRLAAVALFTCFVAYALFIFGPDAGTVAQWWLKILGHRYYPPRGSAAISDLYDNGRLIAWVSGPTLLAAGMFLALYWRSIPLEHAVERRETKRLARIPKGLCQSCGYSREGLPKDSPCPECGKPF